MSINNDHFPLIDPRLDTTPHTIREGMLWTNAASMPIRALNEVVGVAMEVAGVFAPFAVEVIQDLATAVFKACNSKSWESYRQNQINELETKYGISREESTYFFHSVEELGIFAITLGAGKGFKSAKQGTRNLIEQIKLDQANHNIPRPPITNKVIEFTGDVRGRFDFNMQKTGKDQLQIFIKNLDAFENNHLKFAEYGASTKTTGTIIRAFRTIKELALKEGATDVTVRWEIGHKKLIEVATKASKYLELVKKDAKYATFKLKLPNTHSFTSEIKRSKAYIPLTSPSLIALEEEAFFSIGKRHSLKELIHEHSLISIAMQESDEHDLLEQNAKKNYAPLNTYASTNFAMGRKQTCAPKEKEPESVPQKIYETAVKVVNEVTDILPEAMDVHIENPTNFKEMKVSVAQVVDETEVCIDLKPGKLKDSTVSVLYPVGDDVKVGANIAFGKIKDSTISFSKDFKNDSNDLKGTATLNLNPRRIKRSTVSLSGNYKNFTVGAVVKPRNLKNSQVYGTATISKNASVGFSGTAKKIHQGTISGSYVVPVYGIPVKLGAHVSLRKPLDSMFTAAIPIGICDLPVLSLSTKKISIFGLSVFDKGKKKRKKAKRKAKKEAHAAMEAYKQALRVWELDQKKVLEILPHNFKLAKDQWMVGEEIDFNHYYSNIMQDWKNAVSRKVFSGDCTAFVKMVQNKLEGKFFAEVGFLSPFAHHLTPVIPQKFLNLPKEFAALNAATVANTEKMKESNANFEVINTNLLETNNKFTINNTEIKNNNEQLQITNNDLHVINEKIDTSNQQLKENNIELSNVHELNKTVIDDFQANVEALKNETQKETITTDHLNQISQDLALITIELQASLANKPALTNKITAEMRANLFADLDADL